MNVDADPTALEELRAVGVPLVPAVVLGPRAVHGWNPSAYAALLGVAYREPVKLAPGELAARLDRILESAAELVRHAPDAFLAWTPPERDRTVRDLGYHVFRLSQAFLDAMASGELPEAWLQERAPAALGSGEAIAAYGAGVRRRFQTWVASAPAETWARRVAVYYGAQSSHELLERTTWHAAQHLRQLHALATRQGITPPAPLPPDTLAGLPLPDSLW